MEKTFAILIIYDLLITGDEFNINSLCEKLNVSRRTCFRYMNDLKKYFKLHKNSKKVIYDKKANTFKVIDDLVTI